MKRKNFFIRNYLKCWSFAKDSKWFFVFVFGLFSLTFLIGFAFPVFFRAEIFELIEMLMLELEGLGTLGLIGFIFLNNLQASFFAMILGVGFGIVPFMATVVNGYLLGFVAREAVIREGIFALWKILPHGIFELPAVIFSIGIGLRLGLQVIGRGIGKLRGDAAHVGASGDVGYVFVEGLRFFVFVVIPLLVLAGIIEGILIGIT